MPDQLLEPTWTARGTCKPKDQTAKSQDGFITIQEFPYSTQLEKGDLPYGRPIDGAVAVEMIAGFWKRIKEEMPHAWESFLDFDMNFESLLSNKTENEDELKAALRWLFRFLSGSFAMTYDKSILLKILSQPKCEGIRFYMCSKKNLKADQDTRETDQIMSLVLVGVDEKCHDLHYPVPAENQEGSQDKSIPTVSLLAEYGHPPGLFYKVRDNPEVGDAFSIFKYAKVDLSKP